MQKFSEIIKLCVVCGVVGVCGVCGNEIVCFQSQAGSNQSLNTAGRENVMSARTKYHTTQETFKRRLEFNQVLQQP